MGEKSLRTSFVGTFKFFVWGVENVNAVVWEKLWRVYMAQQKSRCGKEAEEKLK